MAPQIHRVLPLPEAAARMGVSVSALTRLITDGKIPAVQLPDGSMAVHENDLPQESAERQEFEALHGHGITISEASKKYEVPADTLRGWIRREYITVLPSNYPMQMDEADVAYCASVYQKRKHELGGKIAGARLFDEAGRPYELHYPDVAEYRRKKKQSGVPKRQRRGRPPARQLASSRPESRPQ